MSNFKLIKTATALALGASLVTSAIVPAEASAASKYKVSKGKLVVKSTGKVATGTYNGAYYVKGVKLTGLKGKVYYKAGKKASGTYKGAYYYKGAKKVTTGTYNKAYYVKGVKKVTTGLYGATYYNAGKKATGTYKGAYYVNGAKKVTTGTYNKAYYVAGKKVVSTGTYKGSYYVAGKKVVTDGLYADKLYTAGELNKGYKLYEAKLYNNEVLNTGLVKHEEKFYFDADLAEGTYEFEGKEEAFEAGLKVGAKVSSIEAVNSTQVKVTFNKSVTKETAEAVANYKSNNVALTAATAPKAELQADNKTVIITLATVQAQKTSLSFQATGVKDVAGNTASSDVFKVLFNDEVAPEVTEVKYDGANVVYTFSEPLATAAADVISRVNGTPTGSVTISGNTVTVAATIAKGTSATLYLTGVKDNAGNVIAPYTGSVTAPNDTVAPTITSVEQISQTEVRIVVSEALATAADLVAADVKFLLGSTVESALTVSKNLTLDPTGKTYDVTLPASYNFTAVSTYATTVIIDAEAFTDLAGNKNAAYNKALTLNKDTVAPVFASAKPATDNSKFELTYNEALVSTGTTVVVTDASGVRHTATAAVSATDTKVLEVTTGGTLVAGTYTIKVTGLKDVLNNTTAEHSTTVTVGAGTDTVAPVATIANHASLKNAFTVAFGEEVTASALSLSNYTLDGAALPAGTDIYFTTAAKTTVEIVLPANTINIGVVGTGTNAILKATNVADLAGNVILAATKNVAIQDNTTAKITNVQVVGTDVFVTFDEAITLPTTTNAASIFTIKDGTTEILAAGVSDVAGITGNAKQLKFTLTAAPTGTVTATIKAAQTALNDANGYVVK